MYLLLIRAHVEFGEILLPLLVLLLLSFLQMDDRAWAAGQLSGPVRKCVRDESGLRDKMKTSRQSNLMSFGKPPELEPLRRKRQLLGVENTSTRPFDCGFKANWTKTDHEIYPPYLKSGVCTERL